MKVIITEKEAYFYKRKGIKFWFTVIKLRIKGIEYETLEDYII